MSFTPTRFIWRFGGRQVHLCGSFTRWVETIPMAPVEGTPGAFAVVVHLPPGYHQYKFIVDGKWMHDETAPYMPDPLGNVNNWLFVRKIDPPPQPVTGITFEQQQQQQQQQQHLLQQQQQQQQQQQVAAAAAAAAILQQQQHHQQQQLGAAQQVVAAQQRAQPPQQPQATMQPPRPQAMPSIPGFMGAGGAGSTAAVAPPGGLTSALLGGGGGASMAAAAAGSGGGGTMGGDVDMAPADSSVVAPIIARSDREPDLTKKVVSDFLHAHTAYELIPESGRAVVLDCDLPVRVAFHALHEQGCASAPVWDGSEGTIVGVVSASDFIHTLQRLRCVVNQSGNNPLSEAEMDAHTIRGMREAATQEGRPPKPLVYVKPADTLAKVVAALYDNRCAMAPILSCDPGGLTPPDVLHVATLGGVLACLLRHFRASLASLPLLAQPLCSLALGTWSEEAAAQADHLHYQQQMARQQQAAAGGGGDGDGVDGSGTDVDVTGTIAAAKRRGGGGTLQVRPLRTVHPSTPLTVALGLLLDAGVSALPVVDDAGVLLDVYARADITHLCRGNAYNRLQWEDVTVGQALSLSQPGPSSWAQGLAPGVGLMTDAHHGLSGADAAVRGGAQLGATPVGPRPGRVAVAARDEPLRTIVERLSMPGVRRLVVVQRGTGRVEGVVSWSDVAAALFF